MTDNQDEQRVSPASTEHTPGPWNVHPWGDDTLEIVGPSNEGIGEVHAGAFSKRDPVAEANARLIAAAPEMYEALRDMLEMHEDDRVLRPACKVAIDAIAKARGGGDE